MRKVAAAKARSSKCSDEGLIMAHYHNDLVPDCADASDEVLYENRLRNMNSYIGLHPIDHCNENELSCFDDKPYCYTYSKVCFL